LDGQVQNGFGILEQIGGCVWEEKTTLSRNSRFINDRLGRTKPCTRGIRWLHVDERHALIPIADERRHAYVRMRESMLAWPNPGHCRLGQAIKSEINLNLP
jgi:hypothetical protein